MYRGCVRYQEEVTNVQRLRKIPRTGTCCKIWEFIGSAYIFQNMNVLILKRVMYYS